MIQHGYNRLIPDRRDLDFHKCFGTVGFDVAGLPDNYSADSGLTMPDQNAEGLPYGCTGEAQADICTDEDLIVYDAAELYFNTPPYSPVLGRDIRDSLSLIVKRGPKEKNGALGPKRYAYYKIEAQGILDWFDATRVALYITAEEHRSATVGLPWFHIFEETQSDGILPAPLLYKWHDDVPGHNAKIAGWRTVNGVPYLLVKSWQGSRFGVNGWCLMSREIANNILSMEGTAAYTVTKITPETIQTISMTRIQNLVSFIRNLLAKYT